MQIASLKVKISDYESKISHMKYLADEKDSEIKKLKDVCIVLYVWADL